jgi:CBS domain-containing protein
MVIGAFIGASVWRLFEPIVPSMGHNPAPFVIVGMMCCFGSISRAPLAVMLMVAEMTGSLSILAPAMIAVGLAWFIVRRGDDTIYRSQLKNRADAPAQRLLTGMPILSIVSVGQAMAMPRVVVTDGTTVRAARHQIEQAGVTGAPVIDDQGRFEGTVALADLRKVKRGDDRSFESVVDVSAPTVAGHAHLDIALEALTTSAEHWVTVLDAERQVLGTVAISDVVRGYRLGLLASLQKVNAVGEPGGTDRVRIESNSPLVGQMLRHAGLPISVIVTTIQRRRDLVVPDGRTVLEAGDELLLIGQSSDIDGIRRVAGGRVSDRRAQRPHEDHGDEPPGSIDVGTWIP